MAEPPRKKMRQLTGEERALWRYVTRNDQRLRPEAEAEIDLSVPSLPAPRVHGVSRVVAPAVQPASLSPLICGRYVDVDGATAARLKRGEYPIHVRLDMHGLTRAEAYDALRGVVEAAYTHGKRCVLVITGKGRADGVGVLKAHLPHWLNDDALRSLVLAFDEAAPKHGGSGAFYVLIKRRRESVNHV